MTKEKAIEQLEWYFEEDNGISADLVTKQAFNTIKKALSQEPCENVVSRQAALNSLIDNTNLEGYDLAEALDAIENKEKLPPVTQKSGKWIRTPLLTCDRCNKINKSGEETDYCPNCGCRMVEPQESEDEE